MALLPPARAGFKAEVVEAMVGIGRALPLRRSDVAMMIHGARAVHIALGRGGHHIELFEKPDDYTTALLGRFRFARRILS